jgi:large subunit ribosomal protein L24
MKIKKGDNVIVMTGKDKGKTGQVIKAFPQRGLIVMAGVNIKKRHERPKKSGKLGQVVEKSAPFSVSNVMIVDPKTKKPSRITIKRDNGKRVRITTKGGSEV